MMMMKSSNMRRHMELQGPRPSPLAISKNSKMMKKKKLPNSSVHQTCHDDGPVIVYLISPKIIHVQPEEFMGLVQRLTGNNQGHQGPSTVNVSHQSCLSKLGGDFSETQIQDRFENRAEYADDQVPFGIPTSAETSNFADICNLASYCLPN